MISEIVNLTTGPVGVSKQVMNALNEPPISHRSNAFKKLYVNTTDLLSNAFQVKETFLLTGSGTLANEVMIQEIKVAGGRGLILSNGEFGSRLIEQAYRNNLDFIQFKREWGKSFDLQAIEKLVIQHSVKWILFCHCETSTGTINDLAALTGLAASHNSLCFVDCMSTVGTTPLNLSKVAMATASSGKGLASIAGLAIVFSNIKLSPKKETPLYLDLYHYSATGGIPFTIPSNLLKALYVSVSQKLCDDQFGLVQEYTKRFYSILNDHSLVPFSTANSIVFSIVAPTAIKKQFIDDMTQQQILVSHESDYLKRRGWCQLATFGYYTESQLKQVESSLKCVMLNVRCTIPADQ